ncbi:DNRLRE domain-containing protein [Streptomyces sp. NPDC087294]|uniref:DNRLRE domain-containing protein n=1 Tax=Streptomyces sp. NPDC087294 TaxID=3365777 RepID=UPI003826B8DC
MAISLVDGASAAIAASPGAVDAPKKPTVTQAADIASATVAARLSGKRVEALSERTETSTTWVNKDGSLTTELSAGPVRFERDGAWVDVDVNLRVSGSGVEPVAHPAGLMLAGKTGTPAKSLEAAQESKAVDLVTLGEGDQRITLQWKGGLPAPKLDGTRAEYVNAVPGADVVVEATRTGFEQYVEIKQQPQEKKGFSYTLPLQAEGLSVKQLPGGSVQFTDKKNKKQAVMPAPVMWDATVDPVSGEHTRRVPVAMKVVKKGSSSVDLVVTPDAKFLTDAKTKYPVTVDPSTSALANVFDTYVQQGETVDWSNDTELDLGNPGTLNADGTPRSARSFITWDTTPVRDSLVKNAKLSLYNFHSGNADCAPAEWTVWATGAASTASRWSNQPEWVEQYASSTETAGRDNCGGDGWINADVTSLVQVWASAKNTRSHMGLRAPSASTTQWKQVNSANAAANPPKLTVTYNFRPKTGTNREAGPPFFSYGGDYTVNTVTPTLRDTFVDVNGDSVIGTFQIADSATGSQVGEILTSEFTASGSPASVKVPSGLLTNGKTYKFRTSPYDGADFNLAWSAWKTFTVDTTAPSAPSKIVSTDYPSDKWVKGEGQAGTFTITPPSGMDHQWLEWSLDGVTWNKVETGGAGTNKTINVTPPKNGTHSLSVRSADKADNKSEATQYTFHAGPGGFLQPLDGARTARRLALQVEVEAGKYDKASFLWRRSEADSWTAIPVADVSVGGTALTAWPVGLANGKNAALTWNATDTVNPDGAIQIKADFTGPNNASGSTEPLIAVVDRNADGASTENVGPGSVNLLTGDFTLNTTDASFFGLTVSRTASSRKPNAGSTQAGQFPIFGKEWVSGTVAEALQVSFSNIRKVSDTALDVVQDDGTAISFTANSDRTGWIPAPGFEDLTLTGAFSGTFTLVDTEGTKTTFAKPTATATTWQTSTIEKSGTADSTSTVVSDTVTVSGKVLARPKLLVAPNEAVSTATCRTTPATRGCRTLEFIYATSTTATGTGTDAEFGDFEGQVKEIRLWATAPGATAATSTAVAGYRYDDNGSLRQSWNPRVGRQAQVQYSYDAGRIVSYEPAGQLPYTFTYGNPSAGSASGEGMLLKVSRPRLKEGSASETDGQAVTSVVYGVPLTGTRAPYAMGASDVSGWGQESQPTDATAILPADSVPSSHSGSTLAAADYRRAAVQYLDASGRLVNTAAPGAHINSTDYDRFGNVIRSLTASNRALALGTTAAQRTELATLGIDGLASGERARMLSNEAAFDSQGQRQLETFGPIRRIDLAKDLKNGTTTLVSAGTSVPARQWTVFEYDKGRPTDGTAGIKNQVTSAVVGALVRDHSVAAGDERRVETQYDWVKGMPRAETKDSGGLDLTTKYGYDAQGRITSVVPPGGTGSEAATRTTRYWAADGSGQCKGRPEWAGLECWSGPGGTITGGGSQPSELPGSTSEYGYLGQVAKKTDTANGSTRTTSYQFDAAGRPTVTTVTGGVGTAVPEVTTTYDSTTGQLVKTASSTGGTIVASYDKLGRVISYTDADGGTTTTTYDYLDRPVQVKDNVPSSVTYTYDDAAEPRGLATKITDSVAGAFTASYDENGTVAKEGLPGGYTVTQKSNSAGSVIDRIYTRNSDSAVVYSDTNTETVHGQISGNSSWSEHRYSYDDTGRLTGVDDTTANTCTRRVYGLDQRSNRSSLTTATVVPGAECSSDGATNTSYSYDSADRLIASGYTYDAFGRTTALPGSSMSYYANDLVRQQTTGTERQTWGLDSSLRFRNWTSERNVSGSWTATITAVNHYSCSCDSPRWIVDNTTTGAISRNVQSASGNLAAVTGKDGGVVLQVTNRHGDTALTLPLDQSQAPVVLDADEYGNPKTTKTRYGWLGNKQRSAETPSGAVLMGVRLYNPETGRFLSIDPVPGGNDNGYIYPADPVNMYDLNGMYRVTWGIVSGTIYFNKRETKKMKSAAEAPAVIAGGLAVLGVGSIVVKWVALNAATIAWHAKQAYDYGRCVQLKWPIAFPGLIPGQYSKKKQGCK